MGAAAISAAPRVPPLGPARTLLPNRPKAVVPAPRPSAVPLEEPGPEFSPRDGAVITTFLRSTSSVDPEQLVENNLIGLMQLASGHIAPRRSAAQQQRLVDTYVAVSARLAWEVSIKEYSGGTDDAFLAGITQRLVDSVVGDAPCSAIVRAQIAEHASSWDEGTCWIRALTAALQRILHARGPHAVGVRDVQEKLETASDKVLCLQPNILEEICSTTEMARACHAAVSAAGVEIPALADVAAVSANLSAYMITGNPCVEAVLTALYGFNTAVPDAAYSAVCQSQTAWHSVAAYMLALNVASSSTTRLTGWSAAAPFSGQVLSPSGASVDAAPPLQLLSILRLPESYVVAIKGRPAYFLEIPVARNGAPMTALSSELDTALRTHVEECVLDKIGLFLHPLLHHDYLAQLPDLTRRILTGASDIVAVTTGLLNIDTPLFTVDELVSQWALRKLRKCTAQVVQMARMEDMAGLHSTPREALSNSDACSILDAFGRLLFMLGERIDYAVESESDDSDDNGLFDAAFDLREAVLGAAPWFCMDDDLDDHDDASDSLTAVADWVGLISSLLHRPDDGPPVVRPYVQWTSR